MAAAGWPKEEIPDGDTLFMRVHKSNIVDGEVTHGAIKDQGDDGMSVNWQRYCTTPEECRQKAKTPAANGAVRFIAGALRLVPMLVEHDPIPDDRSHSLVIGDKTGRSEARFKILDIAHVEILPDT